jgi:hypothetical protein
VTHVTHVNTVLMCFWKMWVLKACLAYSVVAISWRRAFLASAQGEQLDKRVLKKEHDAIRKLASERDAVVPNQVVVFFSNETSVDQVADKAVEMAGKMGGRILWIYEHLKGVALTGVKAGGTTADFASLQEQSLDVMGSSIEQVRTVGSCNVSIAPQIHSAVSRWIGSSRPARYFEDVNKGFDLNFSATAAAFPSISQQCSSRQGPSRVGPN